MEEPAPVGGEGEEEQRGFGERAGEMGYGGVYGNDQVEVGDEGGGLGEVGEVGGEIDEYVFERV